MLKKDFYFDLPEHLIAQTPLLNRDSSKLLVLDKQLGDVAHKEFKDIVDYLKPNDCLVLNETKVIPARLLCKRKTTDAVIELLLLKRLSENTWETLVKPGKKARVGEVLQFWGGDLEATILDITAGGNRIIGFKYEGVFEQLLDKYGEMPLPPYITEKLKDKNRYQTIYAKHEGSAAAPTAGLHFTDEIFKKLAEKNVRVARLTLHVGLGTFRPVKADNILEHEMHAEYYAIEDSQVELINRTKQEGGRIIAVGTTSCRALESCANQNGILCAKEENTNIFIYPGYKFKIVDALITNFHLPESTLIMLVSALAGYENTMNAYKVAVENEYRFFSFGDAMFIV